MPERRILGVDVGGSHVKLLVSVAGCERRRFESGPDLTPGEMVERTAATTADWAFEAVSVGIPAPVHDDHVLAEPVNLGPGWVGFDFEEALGKPTKVAALVADGIVEPLELGHLPFRKATFEDYVGERGRKRLGKKKWEKAVGETIERLSAAFEPDYVVLGGGNAKKLRVLPADVRLGANTNAFLGAFRLWDPRLPSSPAGVGGPFDGS